MLKELYRTPKFRKTARLAILRIKKELEDGEDEPSKSKFESDRKLDLSRDLLTVAMKDSGFTQKFLASRNR
jgi:hypothetical protein